MRAGDLPIRRADGSIEVELLIADDADGKSSIDAASQVCDRPSTRRSKATCNEKVLESVAHTKYAVEFISLTYSYIFIGQLAAFSAGELSYELRLKINSVQLGEDSAIYVQNRERLGSDLVVGILSVAFIAVGFTCYLRCRRLRRIRQTQTQAVELQTAPTLKQKLRTKLIERASLLRASGFDSQPITPSEIGNSISYDCNASVKPVSAMCNVPRCKEIHTR